MMNAKIDLSISCRYLVYLKQAFLGAILGGEAPPA
jgi:hypothetical protein